jgi:hypothetical protein
MAIIQHLESPLGDNKTTFGMVVDCGNNNRMAVLQVSKFPAFAAIRARGVVNIESTADTREGGNIVELRVLRVDIARNAFS